MNKEKEDMNGLGPVDNVVDMGGLEPADNIEQSVPIMLLAGPGSTP